MVILMLWYRVKQTKTPPVIPGCKGKFDVIRIVNHISKKTVQIYERPYESIFFLFCNDKENESRAYEVLVSVENIPTNALWLKILGS